MEESGKKYVKNSLEAFLNDKKNLNQILGVIQASGILKYKGELQKIFNDLRCDYEERPRYQEILKECQKQKWL